MLEAEAGDIVSKIMREQLGVAIEFEKDNE
jgi:hypothetical protein